MCICVAFITSPSFADEKLNIQGNWKLIRSFTNSSGGYIQDITFYDGLGYADQVINVAASPNGKNIVTPVWYDNMRRADARTYLPFVSSGNTSTVKESSPFTSQAAFYSSYINSTEAPYAFYRKSYEPSVLNRLTEQYNTGSVYSDREQTFEHLSNTSGAIKKLDVNSSNNLTISTYNAGELYCSTVTNEDGAVVESFTDKSGRKVMERSLITGSLWAETYYAYDDVGQLSWVISPEGSYLLPASGTLSVSSTVGSKYSYIYKYDGKGNVIEKSVPSKGTEYYVYDRGGRVVMSQDPNQRINNQWLYIVYDNINRITDKNIVTTILSRSQIEQAYNNTSNIYPFSISLRNINLPYGSSPITFIRSLESVRYKGYQYAPLLSEQAHQVTLSNSVYLRVEIPSITGWGANQLDPFGFYLQEDDNVKPEYFICQDINYPYVEYYYIPEVFMDIVQNIIEQDPAAAYEFVYSYPCSGTPASSMTITTIVPPQIRLDNLDSFTVPSSLAFSSVSGVVSVSDVESANTHGSSIYEKVSVLEGSPEAVERAFYYDYMGRPVQVVERNHLGGISRTSSKYDFRGYLLSFHESHQTSDISTADVQLTNYSYDSRGRLLSETTTVNSQSGGTVSYTYDNLGKLISKSYGNGVTESITYNIQGWLTSKSAVKSGSNIFNMTLRYYDPVYATAIYSGNISEMQWQHGAGNNNAYVFVYDNLSRLNSSTRYSNGSPQTSFTERDITYDRNGNITSLKRYGSNGNTPDDNFTYNYDGNRITSITGSVSATYTYDSNGNLAGDGRKNLQMQYNLINLPQTVNQGSVSKARYIWLSDGTKASVVADTLSNNGYTYLGSMLYSRSGSNHTLESVSFGQGRIVHSTGTYTPYYHTTDHLGSVRVITTPTGTIAEQNDYYPFGERTNLGQQYQQLSTNRYKYNGKEEQTTGSLGYLDYGTRFYDPQIARWLRVDPLAHVRSWVSPYNFVQNNPINRIDPDGRLDDWVESANGKIYWDDNATSQATTKEGEKYLGKNVLVGTHNRDASGNESVNSATFDLYLESNKSGSSATIKGNTVPSDITKYGTLAEGLYSAKFGRRNAEKYKNELAIRIYNLDGTDGLPTLNGNPNKANSDLLTGVLFHSGNPYQESLRDRAGNPVWSHGCQTSGCGSGSKGLHNAFMQKVGTDFNGAYYLRVKPQPVQNSFNFQLPVFTMPVDNTYLAPRVIF